MRYCSLLVIGTVLSAAALAPAAIIVDAGGGGDYERIQDGINAASEGDSVIVRPGMYAGPGNRNLSFGGTNITLTSLGNIATTIIDCQGQDRAFYLVNTGEDTTCVISGFTIRNGYGNGDGGGILAHGAALTVQECVIEDCSASLNAGGVYFGYNTRLGRSIIKDCTLSGNHTVYRGGGVFVSHGSAKIIGCTFLGNWTTADSGSSSGGGAINCNNIEATTAIASCTLVGNSSAQNASGIHGYSAQDVLIRTSVIAFGGGGAAVTGSSDNFSMIDYNILYGNIGGNTYPGDHPDNLIGDPLFCDVFADDFTLCTNSPCLPGINGWGELVGAYDTACGDCDSPVEPASWGRIKAMYR